ncbi:hypothetical protein ACFLXC_04270 [Chloroflexota bacterium]
MAKDELTGYPRTLREFSRMSRVIHVKEEQKKLLEGATYQSWEKQFRAAASVDKYALFRDHMQRLALPEKPKLMLDGTILAIQATLAYTRMEGRVIPLDQFMNMQRYNPANAPDARYVFTFNLCDKAYARILADEELILPDLADLYGHPWYIYKRVGYCSFWITHPDWSPLSDEERGTLEKNVTDDLFYDYSEDEVDFLCDVSPDETALYVVIQDVLEVEKQSN